MTTFDRHLIARFLSATLLLVGLLLVFFVVLDYVEYIDDFLDRGATMREVFGVYYLNYIPEIVKLTTPLAVFLAAIFTTARLSQTNQWTALTMSGVSLYRLLRPFVVCTLAITGLMLWFNGFVVPRSNAAVLAFQQQYYRDAPDEVEASDIFRQVAPQTFLSVGYYDRANARAYRVTLQQFETDSTDRRLVRRLDAPQMGWIDSLGVWRLEQAAETRLLADGDVRVRHADLLDTTLTVRPRDLARTAQDAEQLTLQEAADYVATLRRTGATQLGRPLVDYHDKLAYPWASFILVLIGVPLASVKRRGGQALQFILGLGIAFLYLSAQKVIAPFGYAEDLPPAVAAWLPHVLFAAVALVMLARARK